MNRISNHSVFIIAEIAQAHEGSLGIAHSYIDALAETGVDAIKFQTHIAEAESSIYEPFRVKFSYEDETRYDYWKRMEFSPEQWLGIKQHCDKVGLEFISSPFSNAAVDLLEQLHVSIYKIGSGEVSNFLLLEKIARTGKEIIISSGLSSQEELTLALEFLKPFKNKVTLLQCTTAYPTQPYEWGLNVIGEFKNKFNLPVGFSDHSGDIHACLAATALGAEVLEFHAVFDKRMFGPDAKASLEINQIKTLVKGVRQISKSLNSPVVKTNDKPELKAIFEKSLAVNKFIKAGSVLRFEDLEAKKPSGYGIHAKEFKNIIGRTVNKDKAAHAFLKPEDIE